MGDVPLAAFCSDAPANEQELQATKVHSMRLVHGAPTASVGSGGSVPTGTVTFTDQANLSHAERDCYEPEYEHHGGGHRRRSPASQLPEM